VLGGVHPERSEVEKRRGDNHIGFEFDGVPKIGKEVTRAGQLSYNISLARID